MHMHALQVRLDHISLLVRRACSIFKVYSYIFCVAGEVTVIRLVRVAVDRKVERMSNGDRSPDGTRRDPRNVMICHTSIVRRQHCHNGKFDRT